MLKKTKDMINDPAQELGQTLRSRRKELNLTMQVVADEAGLSVGFISQVERGLTSPSLASLVGLAEVLEMPIGEFLKQPAIDGNTTRGSGREVFSVPGADASY